MANLHAIPTAASHNPASPSPVPPPPPHRYKLIINYCIRVSIPAILGLAMVIFLAIPALMPPEFRLDPSSSLSSINISTPNVTARWNIAFSLKNPSKLIPVKYTRMKLLLSFGGELALSCPSRIPAFTQGPCDLTTVQAEALSTLLIVNDLGIKNLVCSLKGGVVTIDVVAKANRRLRLGPWCVPVLDVYFSCTGVTFTAPNNSEGGGDWMILGGNLARLRARHLHSPLSMEGSYGRSTSRCNMAWLYDIIFLCFSSSLRSCRLSEPYNTHMIHVALA